MSGDKKPEVFDLEDRAEDETDLDTGQVEQFATAVDSLVDEPELDENKSKIYEFEGHVVATRNVYIMPDGSHKTEFVTDKTDMFLIDLALTLNLEDRVAMRRTAFGLFKGLQKHGIKPDSEEVIPDDDIYDYIFDNDILTYPELLDANKELAGLTVERNLWTAEEDSYCSADGELDTGVHEALKEYEMSPGSLVKTILKLKDEMGIGDWRVFQDKFPDLFEYSLHKKVPKVPGSDSNLVRVIDFCYPKFKEEYQSIGE